jgi:peptidoglycan/xylan/chitin deacetylase (PgdA/CDA1 family)
VADARRGDPRAPCQSLALTWDELRALRNDPLVSFGAHTMSHAALARCSGDDGRWQIEASIENIEYELGLDCRHFAYPYGDAISTGPREFALACPA